MAFTENVNRCDMDIKFEDISCMFLLMVYKGLLMNMANLQLSCSTLVPRINVLSY